MTDPTAGIPSTALERAQRLIEDRDFAGAHALLESDDTAPESARAELLGLAAFLQSDYPGAASRYESVLALDPSNTAAAEMLARARANAEAEIAVFVPPATYYDR
ncbi:MAG: hypothetical protein ACSLFM_00500, partial [Tepidiformaceae bacterium]